MASVSFVIPLTPEGLIKGDSETRYSIQELTDIASLSEKELHKELDVVYSKIDGSATRIVECDQFDFLFSCLHKFSSLSAACKSSLVDILENGLKGMTGKLQSVLRENPEQYRQAAQKYQNALKMYLFLLCWFIQEEEKIVQEKAAPARGKKKKQTATAGESKWSSESRKESVLSELTNLLDVDLYKVWNNAVPEEEFLNLFIKLSVELLVVPSNSKSKPIKRCLLSILAALAHKYKQSLNVSAAMMEALFKSEHMIQPAADLLHFCVQQYGSNEIVGDFMREVGRMDPGTNRADASGAKNIASFVVSVAEQVPEALLPFVSLIIPHLANESYMLRNGIIQALGHIIYKGFGDADNDRLENIQHRDQFLDILEERFLDMTSYTRSKVIQTWIFLVQNKVVPLKYLPSLTDCTLGRLEDKATAVRKYALQLLTTLIEFNPFASELRLSEFTKKYEEAQRQLKEKSDKQNSEAKAPKKKSDNKENEDGNVTDEMEDDEISLELSGEEDLPEDVEDGDDEREKSDEEKKLEKVAQYYKDAMQFITRIHRSIPVVSKLLGSKVNADVLESIQFFVTANQFKIENAQEGVKNMLVLVWSKEAATKEAVIEAYKDLYINPPSTLADQPKLVDIYVANNFVKLVLSASTTEITSLEELISTLVTKSLLKDSTIQCLWDFFSMKVPNVTPRQSKGALMILSMAANSDPEIVRSKITTLVSLGLGPRWKEDEDIARYTCIALQKLVQRAKADQVKTDPPTRFSPTHPLFERLSHVVLDDSRTPSKWFPAAEQAINTIYGLAERPDSLCNPLIKQLAGRLLSGEENSETDERKTNNQVLSKFLFVLGHVALKHLQYLEDIQTELSRRRSLSGGKSKKAGETESLEDELGINGGDDPDEFIQNVMKNELVLKNLLGSFAPLIIAVCSNQNNQFNDHMVRSSAVIALCKYMCVSADFCRDNLRLIFTLLEKAPEPWIRSDVIISLGDLASRFPNSVDAWTPNLYARLRDPDAGVRKNTLMVLSHLILNEMIRVKGQISEIALCIEDDNQQIADLAKLFFNELNSKGNCLNSIYNILPDMVSNLSASDVPSETFRGIMKYLFAFIEKERETESLIERLCQKRMKACTDPVQLADIAYCLSLLNYSDRSVKKLADNFKCYQAALVYDPVYNSFLVILGKAKKASKADAKAEIEELEKKIHAEHVGDEEENDETTEDQTSTRARASVAKQTRRKSSRAVSPTKRKPRSTRASTKSVATPKKKQPARRSTKKKSVRVVEYSDEEEEEATPAEMELDDEPDDEDSMDIDLDDLEDDEGEDDDDDE